LTTLAGDVLEGSVDRGNAAVAGQLLNTVIKAIGMEMRVREVEDLERQVDELREMVEASKERRRYGA
jgi:archaellum component FlaC